MKASEMVSAFVSIAAGCIVGASLATDANGGDSRWLTYGYKVDRVGDQVIFGGRPYGSQVGERRRHHNRLYKQRVGHNEKVLFFSVEGEWIREFKPSPSGENVAITTQSDGTTITLRVVNDAGEEIATVTDGWDFSWSPDGSRLAYATGAYESSSDDAPFHAAGTWIFDIQASSTKEIYPGGRYVSWARFDGRIYIYEIPDWSARSKDRVILYDPASSTTKNTENRGIYFSPSGQCYFMSNISRGEPRVYDADTNESLWNTSRILENLRPESLSWLPIDKDLLVFYSNFDSETGANIRETRALVFDPVADRVTELHADAVIGKTARGHLVTIEEGRTNTRRLIDLVK